MSARTDGQANGYLSGKQEVIKSSQSSLKKKGHFQTISRMACVLTVFMEEDPQVKGRLSGKTLSNQNASGIQENLEVRSKPWRVWTLAKKLGFYSADNNEPW